MCVFFILLFYRNFFWHSISADAEEIRCCCCCCQRHPHKPLPLWILMEQCDLLLNEMSENRKRAREREKKRNENLYARTPTVPSSFCWFEATFCDKCESKCIYIYTQINWMKDNHSFRRWMSVPFSWIVSFFFAPCFVLFCSLSFWFSSPRTHSHFLACIQYFWLFYTMVEWWWQWRWRAQQTTE